MEKVMLVNSPRLRAVRRVESKTEGLVYTGLTARYETIVEESEHVSFLEL